MRFYAWVLFVGTKMLGFSEKEVGHMTIKKWMQLFNYFRTYHNSVRKRVYLKKKSLLDKNATMSGYHKNIFLY